MTVRTYVSPLGRMRMLAGDPALDFANTLHWRSGREVDFIPDYGALLDWSVPAGLLRDIEVQSLSSAAVSEPDTAYALHARILDLRTDWRSYLNSAVGGDGSAAQADFPTPLASALSDLLAQGQPILGLGVKPSRSEITL